MIHLNRLRMPNQSYRVAGRLVLVLGANLPLSQAAMAAPEEIPVAKFTDITSASGIGFTHVNGAYGDKLLPETMGGGVAFLDFENNGHQDLLFVNSGYWPAHSPPVKQDPTLG